MATNRGAAVVFGTGITATVGIVWDNTKALNQSEDFRREADKAEIRDANGDVVGCVYHNLRKTLSITVVPADNDGTPAAATGITNADLFLVAPGTLVTIADANSAVVDGDNGSKWLLESSSRRTTNTGEAVCDITLIQYDANDVAVAVS